MAIALFPFKNPITEATGCLGGIAMHMCTWSGMRCPSTIRHSFCFASAWKIAPNWPRNRRRSLSVVVWARTLRDTCSPIWNGLGSDKRLTLHPLLVGFHQATWRGFYTRKDSRNGQTFSSLTGRTSGLPISVRSDSDLPRWSTAAPAVRVLFELFCGPLANSLFHHRPARRVRILRDESSDWLMLETKANVMRSHPVPARLPLQR